MLCFVCTRHKSRRRPPSSESGSQSWCGPANARLMTDNPSDSSIIGAVLPIPNTSKPSDVPGDWRCRHCLSWTHNFKIGRDFFSIINSRRCRFSVRMFLSSGCWVERLTVLCVFKMYIHIFLCM